MNSNGRGVDKAGHHRIRNRNTSGPASREDGRFIKKIFYSILVMVLLVFVMNSFLTFHTLTTHHHQHAESSNVSGPHKVRRTASQTESNNNNNNNNKNNPVVAAVAKNLGSYPPPPEIPEPAWWFELEQDDYFGRVFDYNQDGLGVSKLHSLRNLSYIKKFYNHACGLYRFNTTAMPDMSVIVTVQNEQPQLLSITVHSLLARTPPEILKEIIVVDDNGIPPHYRGTKVNETEFQEIKSLSPKVSVIKNYEREGCARSRMIGARAATGTVLMFVDSHIEMTSSTWAQHLLVPIMENPHTMALQTLDVIDDQHQNHSYGGHSGALLYGSVDDSFIFTYQNSRFPNKGYHEPPTKREPYETPFGPGSLFAIRRDEFWRLGGYDKGLYVWGGENTELALKIWTCGGRMVMVPCSRCGHMYRVHIKETGRWPPHLPQELTDSLGLGDDKGRWIINGHKSDNFTRIVGRNNIRIMSVWVGDHEAKREYYDRTFGTRILPPEWRQFETELEHDVAAQEQIQLKKQNQCKDFEWFDKHVFMKTLGVHHPWHASHPRFLSCGAHKATSCDKCPQGHGASWCNGDCTWCPLGEGSCVPKKNKTACMDEPPSPFTDEETEKALKAGLTISVVLPCGFEHQTYVKTAQSIYETTPDEVLQEIVIVDDASEPPLKDGFPDAEDYKVKWVRNKDALGLIGAKHVGAEAATGDVVIFFDCHVKPGLGYWVPFVNEIKDNYRRVVVPTITALDVEKWEEKGRPTGGGGGMSKCYLTFDAEFKWTNDDTKYVPIMSGGLLGMSRRWFFEIGGYDMAMRGWGGENLDQSLRIWRCGGEIVSAQQSYVAHMWRDENHRARYHLHPGDAALNRARAMKAHVGPWFEKTLTFPSFARWQKDGGKDLNITSIDNDLKDLKCESFEWFLQRFAHIYRDAGVLPAEVFQLEATNMNSGSPMCLQLAGHSHWNNAASPNDKLKMAKCETYEDGVDSGRGTQLWHPSNRNADGSCCSALRVWNTDQCLSMGVGTNTCSLNAHTKAQLTDDGLLQVSGNCLSVHEKTKQLILLGCDDEKVTKWKKSREFSPMEFTFLNKSLQTEWRKLGTGKAQAKVA